MLSLVLRHVLCSNAFLRREVLTSKSTIVPMQPMSGHNISHDYRGNPPSSTPPSTNLPESFRTSGNLVRQTNSTPVPTRRYLTENKITSPSLIQTAFGVPELAGDEVDSVVSECEDKDRIEGLIVGDGSLNPTKNGTYSNRREVELVDGKAIHKVTSVSGMIQNVDYSPNVKQYQQVQVQSASSSPGNSSNYTGDQTLLEPDADASSAQSGVWENNPHVVKFDHASLLDDVDKLQGSYASSIQSDAPRFSSRPRMSARSVPELARNHTNADCKLGWAT